MSATPTLILAAVKSAVEAADPGIPVLVRQRPPEPLADPRVGWKPGDPATCWILSMAREDAVDRLGTFEHRSVDYAVTMSYVRPYLGGVLDEDPVVRDKKAAIRTALHTTGLAAAGVFGVPEWREGLPYQTGPAGNTLLSVSDQTATYHAMEPRA